MPAHGCLTSPCPICHPTPHGGGYWQWVPYTPPAPQPWPPHTPYIGDPPYTQQPRVTY